eukprot:TRINITY_DN2433_c0_g1_i1.p1 TRINITY_DN2433_c0_g1~~TRINITY_DN2433_c0_g1_i1.p1  ORF type:complete len:224 (+),score=76.30 TRINITY_DN2433_c0_g1_i1:219-890(+)
MSIWSSTGGDFVGTSSTVSGAWPPSANGRGAEISGTVLEIRNHTLQDNSKRYHRYVAYVVRVGSVRQRTFGDDGNEIDTRTVTEKLVGKGHLNVYDHRQLQDKDALTPDQWLSRLHNTALPIGVFDEQLPKLHPRVANVFEFWADAALAKPAEIKKGDEIRLKTKGDSFFIESFSKLVAHSAAYSGENVIGGWTSKIAVGKAASDDKPLPGANQQGADDSEWD